MRTQNADRADIRISNLKRLAYLSSSVSAQIRAVFLMHRITGCRSRRSANQGATAVAAAFQPALSESAEASFVTGFRLLLPHG